MNKIFILLILFAPFSLVSCKRPPATSSDDATPAAVVSCSNEEIDFLYFASKAKMSYKDKQNDLKSNFNVRIKKDSIIWVSVNAAAGFEALRILITTDSLHVINRLNNSYTVYDFISLSDQLNTDLSYKTLQAIILGNLVVPKKANDILISTDSSYCVFKQKTNTAELINYIKISIGKIDKVEMAQGTENNLTINYFNFVPLGNYSFASKNEICLKHKEGLGYQTTNIDIDHNKPEFPEKELNFPFNVPNKFTRTK